MTAHQEIRGKPLGESVLFKPHREGVRLKKAAPRGRDGIWNEFHPRNHEHIVSDEGEIVPYETIHRRPPENMWSKQLVPDIKGTPWNHKGGEAVMDHEVTTGRRPIAMKDPTARAAPTTPRAPIGQIGKRVYITENSVDEFGATLGCRGCLANGVTSTEACRARLTERSLNALEHA